MSRIYAVALGRCNGTPSEYEPTVYGGDYARTIKDAIAKASAGEVERDAEMVKLGTKAAEKADVEDIRGLIHNEADRVYAAFGMYGYRYFNVSDA